MATRADATVAADRPRGSIATWVAVGCYVMAIGSGFAGSQVQAHDSAATYRLLQDVPALVDVCGDYTWAARAVPPLLALAGAAVATRAQGSRSVRIALAVLGLLLASGLLVATTQNAIPWGEQHCIVD